MAAGKKLAGSNSDQLTMKGSFKDDMISGGDPCGVFDRAAQLKADVVVAFFAKREALSFQQSGLMH